METLANFFEWINELFGVSSGGELLFHPVFLGFCIAMIILSIAMHWKASGIIFSAMLGGAVCFRYLWPENTSNLGELVKFLAAAGGLALVLVYFAFIRE
jgi:hypothetical protein